MVINCISRGQVNIVNRCTIDQNYDFVTSRRAYTSIHVENRIQRKSHSEAGLIVNLKLLRCFISMRENINYLQQTVVKTMLSSTLSTMTAITFDSVYCAAMDYKIFPYMTENINYLYCSRNNVIKRSINYVGDNIRFGVLCCYELPNIPLVVYGCISRQCYSSTISRLTTLCRLSTAVYVSQQAT
ncbi:hypothetical protein TrispH2_000869 [Trichoplax sp. H2]|nr:hypothetical protein TrispH2_000869 [Trichoplax sp. H2]|eukprot:RDD47533.1 hypothetical protein TrispH2_000869 [Trichoplax sp. H2]